MTLCFSSLDHLKTWESSESTLSTAVLWVGLFKSFICYQVSELHGDSGTRWIFVSDMPQDCLTGQTFFLKRFVCCLCFVKHGARSHLALIPAFAPKFCRCISETLATWYGLQVGNGGDQFFEFFRVELQSQNYQNCCAEATPSW